MVRWEREADDEKTGQGEEQKAITQAPGAAITIVRSSAPRHTQLWDGWSLTLAEALNCVGEAGNGFESQA